MSKKIKDSFPLDSLAYQYLFLGIPAFFLINLGLIVLGVLIKAEIGLKIFIIFVSIPFTVIFAYLYNPLPFVLTRVSIDETSIKLKKGKKVFVFALDDIEEIAIVHISKTARIFKENSKIMKAPKLHFCISKNKDFFQTVDMKNLSMQKEYLINKKQCLIPIIELEFFKPFLSRYNKEIINLEKYKDCLTDGEYFFLNERNKRTNGYLTNEQMGTGVI